MNIKPSAAIRNNYNEISAFCKTTGEPIYLTKNGEGDIVVMSIEGFKRREDLLRLKAKLAAVEKQRSEEGKSYSVEESRERLNKLIHGQG